MAHIAWDVWVFWGLTTGVAIIDVRRHEIPHWAIGLGLANAGVAIVLRHAWGHVIWMVGLWVVFEMFLALFPNMLGWGDVKWSAVTMATLGATGLLIVLAGLVGTYVGGKARGLWRRAIRHIREPSRYPMPWAPAAWGGLTALLAAFVMVSR